MLKEKGFHKGVDLGGWMSQCDYSEDRLNNFITESDIEKIASWGLDHVRLPIDYNVLENEDGTQYKQEGFDRIHKLLAMAKKNGLKVVIDLHKTSGFSFDKGEQETGFFENEECRERFIRLWEELARQFGKYSDMSVFELLNEVTSESYIDVWNETVAKCIPRIRKYAPDTLILVGSYHQNSPHAVKDLDKPYDDKVLYNFHCYSPLKFTHQGAYWAEELDQNARYSFDEAGITPELFEQEFAPALEHAKKYGTELYCGEYGVIDIVSPEDTLKWFKAINAVFEKYGIARAAWSYKGMDFGLTDSRLDDIRPELIKYL